VSLDRATDIADQAEQHFATQPGKLFIPRAVNAIDTGQNNIVHKYASLEEAFPTVDPGHKPLGNLLLVQIRQPKMRTSGGVILDTELRKTEQNNTQVAKVVMVGPLAFCARDTAEPWPEGAWCKVGDFVRIPKYAGERFVVPFQTTDWHIVGGRRIEEAVIDNAEFCFIKDLSLIATVDDPLTVRAYL
jgi:co-chaperonin GroES (HSP10)